MNKGSSRAGWTDSTVLKEKDRACDYIDITYVELEEKPVHAIFNASNILGSAALLAMLAACAAVEGGSYITALILIGLMAICARMSMKEDGKHAERRKDGIIGFKEHRKRRFTGKGR